MGYVLYGLGAPPPCLIGGHRLVYVSDTKGAFTRHSKNGTDPTKTGTVPTVFAKKQ